jgi:5'-nucleotidase
MTILISNDDGINAKGLRTLRDTLAEEFDIMVVAPDKQQSASSHSLTLHNPLRVEKLDDINLTVNGTPTDCIMLAVRELMKDDTPELVISGINHGANVGDDVTYSGTVAAAFEGSLLGIPSLAISLDNHGKKDSDFGFAAEFARKVVRDILDKKFPSKILLNINVPDINRSACEGVSITRLGKRHYKDAIVRKTDPRGRDYYWVAGTPLSEGAEKDTDIYALNTNRISVTPLHLDLTHHPTIATLKKWNWEI